MSRPYQPSNGTEGETFMERFCYRCARMNDKPHGCKILGLTYVCSLDSEDYPKEWTIEGVDLRTAKCSAFTTEPPQDKLCPKCRGLGLQYIETVQLACGTCDGAGAVTDG